MSIPYPRRFCSRVETRHYATTDRSLGMRVHGVAPTAGEYTTSASLGRATLTQLHCGRSPGVEKKSARVAGHEDPENVQLIQGLRYVVVSGRLWESKSRLDLGGRTTHARL